MLRILLRCKNVRSERIAKHLNKVIEGFKIWAYENDVYALFEIDSLEELKMISRKLRVIKNVDFQYVRIQTVDNYA